MDLPKGKPQQAVGWSPPLVGDFHVLDKFGELAFGDAQGSLTPPPPPPVPSPDKGAEATGGKAGKPKHHKKKTETP